MANTTTRRARKKVPNNETPEQKFTRLINARSGKLVHQMQLLKNLSTSYAYKIDPQLTEKWLSNFQTAYSELKGAWEASIAKSKGKAEVAVKPVASETAPAETASSEKTA